MCARKNKDFKAAETALLRVSSKELEFGKELKDLESRLGDADWLSDDVLGDVIERLPAMRSGCRDGATQTLEAGLKQWLKQRVVDLCASEDGGSEEALLQCQRHLAFFSSTEAGAQELQDPRTAIADKLRSVQAMSSVQGLKDLADAASTGEVEDLKGGELLKKIDACKGHDMSGVMEAITTIEQTLYKLLMDSATNIEADGSAVLQNLVKNYCAIAEHVAEPILKPTVVNALVHRACAFFDAWQKYRGGASKVNALNFNKAALGYCTWKLPVAHQHDSFKELLRAFLTGLVGALTAHNKLQEERSTDATETFKAAIAELLPHAMGSRDGGSWKEGLPTSPTLKQVLGHAVTPRTGLLNGPGKLVKETKETLREACIA
jgi:hypothetical protein